MTDENGRILEPWEVNIFGEPLTGGERARAFMDSIPNNIDHRTVHGYSYEIEDYLSEEPTEL